MKMPFTPTSKEIAAMLEHVRYEITHCFVIPEHDSSDPHILRSIFLSVFVHARILITFFESTERREDDVLCSDFGFPASPIPLSSGEPKRFKKDLMHLAYARMRHTPDTKPWPIEEIGRSVGKRSHEFICHVVEKPPAGTTPAEWKRCIYMKDAFQQIRV